MIVYPSTRSILMPTCTYTDVYVNTSLVIHACIHTLVVYAYACFISLVFSIFPLHSQISDGLNYLHSHQIVHLDMKSPNVLVWEFPIAAMPRKERLKYAGNVWLKIADYGISQVATSMMMKVTTNQPGTPGYMAPELFETGQEIYSTKVRKTELGERERLIREREISA